MRVHPLSCGFGYGFLVETGGGLYLVDCGSPGFHAVVLKKMGELGRSDLKLIWITHAHYDHYGSALALRAACVAAIGIHPADAASMAEGGSRLGSTRSYGFVYPAAQAVLNRVYPLLPTEPDFTLEDGESLEGFGLEARVVHTPGHTPGHTCLLLGDGTVFAGDMVGQAFQPYPQRLLAMDWGQIPASLERLKSEKPARLFSGHSPRPVPGQAIQRMRCREGGLVSAGPAH